MKATFQGIEIPRVALRAAVPDRETAECILDRLLVLSECLLIMAREIMEVGDPFTSERVRIEGRIRTMNEEVTALIVTMLEGGNTP